MKSGGEITGLALPVNEHVLRYTFMGVCGPADECEYKATRAGFEEFLALPRHEGLLREIETTGTSPDLSRLYRLFLVEGGNSPARSFMKELQRTTSLIMAENGGRDRYLLWSSLLANITGTAESLIASMRGLARFKMLAYANRLDLLFDRVEAISRFYAERVTVNSSSTFEDVIVFLQSEAAETLRPYIKEVLEIIERGEMDQLARIELNDIAERFGKAWDEFNDPFAYVGLIAGFLDKHRMGVKVMLDDPRRTPSIKPADPEGLRYIMNRAILFAIENGRQKHPVNLGFGWDKERQEMHITFRDLWAPMQTNWAGLVLDLSDYSEHWRQAQTSLAGHTIYLPVQLFPVLPAVQPLPMNLGMPLAGL